MSNNWIDTSSLDMDNEGIKAIVNDTNKKLDEFDKEHFVAEEGNNFWIYTESINEDGEFILKRLSYKNFAYRYNCNDVYVPTGNKKNPFIKKGIASYWMSCPQKRTYDNIIFKPQKSEARFYNLWRGFKIMPKHDGEFKLIERHLKDVWCNGNEDYYNYILKWFAHLVQYPCEKPCVALVIKGEKGTGKTGFISRLANKLLGEHYLLISSGRDLYGNFNAQQFGRLLITFDEAVWNGDKGMEGKLKSLITETNTLIEKKGMDSEVKKNYARYILLTNERFAVPATYDERRFFAMRMSSKYRNNTDYFKELYHAMDSGEVENFLEFLMNYKFEKEDVYIPPASSALFEDVYEGIDVFDKWLFSFIDDYAVNLITGNEYYNDSTPETISFGKFVRTKVLFDRYREFKEGFGQSSSVNTQTKFTQKMTNGKDGSYSFCYGKHDGYNCIFLPPIDEAKNIFQKKYSCDVEWTNIKDAKEILSTDKTINFLKRESVGSKYYRKKIIKESYAIYKDKKFSEEFKKIFDDTSQDVA